MSLEGSGITTIRAPRCNLVIVRQLVIVVNTFGGEGQDRTDDLRVMNPALSPAELHHHGVSYENRTHDSGITTRGFATKLTSP